MDWAPGRRLAPSLEVLRAKWSLRPSNIANEPKASAEPSVNVKPACSSLTDLAQQNVGKRNSLIPAKKESRLPRLLQK
jgi:hypothetical protein